MNFAARPAQARNRRSSGARDRVTMSQGAAFSAGELTSAYEHASHPYQGERLSMGAEVITPTTERNVRQRQET